MNLTVAIVGRPNVGKSTLFNRLCGKKHAIVHDEPGVTRDWREAEGSIGPLSINVMDTAGFEKAEKDTLQARMSAQTQKAMQRADAIIVLLDGRAGLLAQDKHIIQAVRKLNRPIVLVVNKAEGGAAKNTLLDAYSLGLGEPVAISAEHGEGMVDLYEALAEHAPEETDEPAEELVEDAEGEKPLSIAIVGRPNVGKSTLINQLLGEERVLTGPEAGITRDAIAVPFMYKGKALTLVDTAGMRRKSKVDESLEFMSVGDTLRAIQYAEVVVVMFDAELALEKQDNTIAALIEREGRAMVIAINKWDKVQNQKEYLKVFEHRLEEVFPQMRGIRVVTMSAEKGKGVEDLLKACMQAHKVWNKRISTADLNGFLQEALLAHTPPLINGRRLKIRYMTQTKTRPPTFTLFSNLSEIPDHYMRYIVNNMRTVFKLEGVPIRIKIKKNANPYQDKK